MKRGKFLIVVLLFFIANGTQVPGAGATVVRKLDEKQLVDQAEVILIGTCTSIRSAWNENGSKIFSYITVAVHTFVKGDQIPQEITVKQLGGEVGGLAMLVDETSVFEEGEEVLLFLKKGREGYYRTVGLYQGKYSIETDAATGRKILLRKKHRYGMAENRGVKKKVVREKPPQKIFLDEFTDRVRNILQKKD